MKDFADDNFKFDENGRKLSKRVENTMGKGEIARYEQFLLFPQCFQKACFPGASKDVTVWEWVKLYCGGQCTYPCFPVLHTIIFQSQWLLSHITIIEPERERGMNPVTMTIINTWKEH